MPSINELRTEILIDAINYIRKMYSDEVIENISIRWRTDGTTEDNRYYKAYNVFVKTYNKHLVIFRRNLCYYIWDNQEHPEFKGER